MANFWPERVYMWAEKTVCKLVRADLRAEWAVGGLKKESEWISKRTDLKSERSYLIPDGLI